MLVFPHIVNVLYHSDPLNKGLQLENLVNMGSTRWDNMELALRLETNVINHKHHFCTDSNGLQVGTHPCVQ